jgi:transcriptional regulator with XRE-family HTH domain
MEKKYIKSGRYIKTIRLEIGKRLNRNITQEELAIMFNLSKSYISSLEAGYKKVSESMRFRYLMLCNEYDIIYDIDKINNN